MKPNHFSLYLQTCLAHLGGVPQQYSDKRRTITFNLVEVEISSRIAEHPPDPLIKSQVQSGPEPNIDKKAQLFRSPRAFSSTTARCIFCPRSGTNKHSRGLKVLMDRPSTLQAAFADINIAKDRSVYF